ncbi:hypothetical protein K227x_09940 [Rubripirellula lacrimiformis]|uniref:Threonine/serine exporter-like N-terminal domain-containing protein n=2 Tax=Rubripirellula lacrimiformis TaxID=1930273 RepID=A0A517N649_9BACT|nr:hypothetical protein K227x_09940 [Rubripirellula lacrimiformis]
MWKVATSMGITSVFLYTPTALVISLEDDESECTVVRRADSGQVDVDKLISLDDLLTKVEAGTVSIDRARKEMVRIDEAASQFAGWVYGLANSVACMVVAVFFQGSADEIVMSGVVGLFVVALESIHRRWQLEPGLLEPVSGMVAAVTGLMAAHFLWPMDDRLVALAGLIVLIPGLRVTIGLTELAVGHLSAGVARLAGALVSLATMFVGVALVWRVAGGWRWIPDPHIPVPLWWSWIALAVSPIAFAIVFRAGYRQWPIIAAVSICGVATSWTVAPIWGAEIASFLASLAVGCGSNLYARIADRPAMVALTPSMLILVPGSLGYRSLAALSDQQTIEGIQFGFAMLVVGLSIVGGLLMANLVVPPRRIL